MCSLVIHICKDNIIKIRKESNNEMFISAEDKKKYCQIAIDAIQDLRQINQLTDKDYLQKYHDQIK